MFADARGSLDNMMLFSFYITFQFIKRKRHLQVSFRDMGSPLSNIVQQPHKKVALGIICNTCDVFLKKRLPDLDIFLLHSLESQKEVEILCESSLKSLLSPLSTLSGVGAVKESPEVKRGKTSQNLHCKLYDFKES